MDEERALQILDQELAAAFGAVSAPPTLAAGVMRRVRKPNRMPELLDGIGALAILTAVLAAILYLEPALPMQLVMLVTSALAVLLAFAFALRILNEA